MNFNEYHAAALRTAPTEGQLDGLIHASLGLATESGEFTTEVKRMARYGAEMNAEVLEHMTEELGDVLWYVALACDHLGVSMHAAAKANIAKLEKRFPHKFSEDAALARADKDGASHRES